MKIKSIFFNISLFVVFACNNGSIINKMQGGCMFPDLDQDRPVDQGSIGCDGPDWLTIKPGLNIASECPSLTCPSKCEYVWIPVGLGKHNIVKIMTKDLKCSACGKDLEGDEIIGIGLYKCFYEINGVKLINKYASFKERKKFEVYSMTSYKKIDKYFASDWTLWPVLNIETKTPLSFFSFLFQ